MNSHAQALKQIQKLLGPKGWVGSKYEMQSYLSEERGLYNSTAAGVACPASTEEVAQVVKICNQARLGIVPQGGNTGLVGGCVSDFPDNNGIILSTRRINTIRHIDRINQTMTVEAGVILNQIQRKANEAGLLFPLSLAAEGSCQIGGNLSTNAGGIHVLRYGNARDMVLGLEVVLPDGRIWDGLRCLRKDNTGYDLKHLFMGAEGSLGVITTAVLKLYPQPRYRDTAICGATDVDSLLTVLHRLRECAGEMLSAFEIMNRFGVEIANKHIDSVCDPFTKSHKEYALIELSGSNKAQKILEDVLTNALDNSLISDAIIAATNAQKDKFWAIREAIPEAQKHEGGSIKHDISVAVSSVGEFIKKASKLVEKKLPGVRICSFGHAGDGNIHFNLSQPLDADREIFMENWSEINALVHDLTMDMKGSFSAEHGIGRLKRNDMIRYKSEVEMDLMRTLKNAFDPFNIMNPGKII